jgi:hypothetical protein
MKISSLFDLITDANDVIDLMLDRVETPEQFVSRLDRLKRQGAEELRVCLMGLRASVTAALDDQLEMNAALDEPTDDDSDLTDLEAQFADLETENQISAASPPAEDTKKDDPTPK